jgi:hypothetical protein
MEEEFDVVIDALKERRDRLWKMTQSNMNCEFGMGIMDDIRLDQIEQLDNAMQRWRNNEKV